MPPRPPNRAGLVLIGALGGLFVVALVLWLYLRLAQVGQVEREVAARLNLPPGTLELEEISDEGRLRISLRDVLLVGDAGDTVAAAPRVTLWFDPSELSGDGPLVFSDVVLEEPDLRLVQLPAGGWNILRALRLEAGGREVAGGDAGRPLLFTDIRVEGGRVAVAIPGEPPDTSTFAGRLAIPRRVIGGVTYQVFVFRGVDARLPRVLVGGGAGWEAEVGALAADLAEPDLAIRGLSGRFAARGEDAVEFDLRSLRLGSSEFSGSGTIAFAGDDVQYDVEIVADPLAFSDLAALVPGLPEDGRATFTLVTEPLGGGRTELSFQGLDVDALEARFGGRLGMVVGGGEAPIFRDTELTVASLELSVLQALGFVDDLPVAGVVAGTLSTEGAVTAEMEGALHVDLAARLTPVGEPDAEPSVVRATGGIALGGPGSGLLMRGLRIELERLHLATLRGFAPERADRLRGLLRGAVTLDGTTSQVRLTNGALRYEVGDATPTELTGLTGTIALEPALSYDLRAVAEPLSLATLTELFPGLPFRTAKLEGPITLTGGAERVAFSADLEGPAGALAMRGDLRLGETPVFNVSGDVRTLTPAALLRADLPIEGAVTGTFAASGTPADLRFNVDLQQTAGRFALEGRMIGGTAGAPPRFTVSGDVVDFRVGALIGQPGLFPAPMTGRISLVGGAADPYQFDIDLRGAGVALDLSGSYAAADVPSYSIHGTVRGLDLSRLPLSPRLPRTVLNARVDIEGSGTTPETLRGTYLVRAEGSRVSGIPLDVAVLDAVARDGLLLMDTLALQLGDTRLAAAGSLGLTSPSADQLTFSLVSPDLATVARAAAGAGLPLNIAGAVRAQGWITGTLEYPRLAFGLSGRDLEYNEWRAGELSVEADLTRSRAAGWSGEGNLEGTAILLATGERLQRLQLRASGDQQRLGVGLYARRDRASDITAAGVLDLDQGVPRGVTLESLALRLEGTAWTLASRSRLRWGGVDGLAVDNLLLERTDGGEGTFMVNGVLPPTGTADLEVRIRSLGLSTLASLVPGAPALDGLMTLDAVLEGPVSDPTMSIDARIDSLQYAGAAADSISLTAFYSAGALQADAAVWRDGRSLLDGEARVPMVLALDDLIPSFDLLPDQPLTARVVADSLDFGLLTAAVPQLADGQGTLSALAVVGGTVDRPELQGNASLHGGAVRVVPLGVRYQNIAAGVSLEGQRIVIDSISAFSDGTGRITGTVEFRPGVGPVVDLAADLRSFEVMDVRDGARVQVSANLSLAGAMPSPVLTGEMTISESTFEIPELTQGSTVALEHLDVGRVGPDTIAPAGPLPPFLSGIQIEGLVVNVSEGVWLNSDDARIQIAGNQLVVYRTGEDIRVWGVLTAERGTYSLRIGPLVREFEIVSGSVQFFGTEDLNPELDITAANRIRTVQTGGGTEDIDILVNITGTVQFPRISLSSNTRPPLPESEIMSLLLFGRPTFGLGGATGRLAQEVLVQEAIGGILFAPLEEIFLQTGLIDYVQFRSVGGDLGVGRTLGLTTVEVGAGISDNVFLTLECGVGVIFGGTGGADGAGGSACGTRLEVELGRNFTASAAYEPIRRSHRFLDVLLDQELKYQWSLELRKRWEYGISDGDVGIGQPAVPLDRQGAARETGGGRETGGRP